MEKHRAIIWKQVDFPHCLGAIDDKHIIMQNPVKSGSLFYNYKKSFVMLIMNLPWLISVRLVERATEVYFLTVIWVTQWWMICWTYQIQKMSMTVTLHCPLFSLVMMLFQWEQIHSNLTQPFIWIWKNLSLIYRISRTRRIREKYFWDSGS